MDCYRHRKRFSLRSRDVNYAVVHNLLNAEKYFTMAIFTFSFRHDLRAQFGRGQLTLPRYFYNLVSASPLRQLSWCLTNSRVHKERKKFDGRYRVTGRLGAFLLLFFSFLEGMHGRGPNKIETHSESMMRCPKFDLTYKRSGFEG